jgi:hypothetical protein
MKTRTLRLMLMKIFQCSTYRALRSRLQEATHPFPVTVDWRCMALGRKKDGRICAFGEVIGRMSIVLRCFVSECFTYIQFVGDDITIYRYQNPKDMMHQLKFFDEHGMFDDMEDGDVFILEPVGLARSMDYAKRRRDAIAAGEHIVVPRGPNVNMRRTFLHHFRPY